jgi:hypothetical protein
MRDSRSNGRKKRKKEKKWKKMYCERGMLTQKERTTASERKGGVGTCRSRSGRPTRSIVCDDGLYELAEYESSSLYDDSRLHVLASHLQVDLR